MMSEAAAEHKNGAAANQLPSTMSQRNTRSQFFRKKFLQRQSLSDERPQVTRYRDHFSLLTPTSTVRFQDSHSAARVICNQGSQLILEEIYDSTQKKRHISIKRIPEEAGGLLRLFRATYVVFSAFMFGFLFVLSIQIIFFVILDLAVAMGETELQKAEYRWAVGVLLSLPLLIHGMACAMMLAGTFVIDAWKGHYLFNKFVFPSLRDYLVEWIFFLGFLGVPLLVMGGYLLAKNDNWWEYTSFFWFLSIFVFFVIFILNVLWYEARVFYRIVGDSDMIEDYGSIWGRIYACILLRQQHSLSGLSVTKYASFGTPEGAMRDSCSRPYTVEGTLKENQRGLYTRMAQLNLFQGLLFKKLERPRRILSMEEIMERRPYLTTYTWSLERYFFRPRRSRYISIIEGPGALQRAQIWSTFVCSLMGLCLVYLLMAAVLVYHGSGGRIAAGVVACFVCLSLPVALKPFTIFFALRKHKMVTREMKGGNSQQSSNRLSRSKNDNVLPEVVDTTNSKRNDLQMDAVSEVSENPSDEKEEEEEQSQREKSNAAPLRPSARGRSIVSGESAADGAKLLVEERQGYKQLKSSKSMARSEPVPSNVDATKSPPQVDVEWAGFAKDEEETSQGVYFVFETYRVTEPTKFLCKTTFVIYGILFVIWPTVSLFVVENVQLSTLYLFVAVASAVRYYTDCEVLLEELGGLAAVPDRHDEDKNWQTQSRLSEVMASIAHGRSYFGWRIFYCIFTLICLVFGGMAVGASLESRDAEEYTFVNDFHYKSQNSVQYASCTVDENIFQGIPEMTITDYSFLAKLAYRTGTETREDLIDWFGRDKVLDKTEIADEFRKSDELDMSSAFYKLFSINGVNNTNLALISIRGTHTAWDFLADFQLWSASIFLQMVRSGLPFGAMYTPMLHRVSKLLSNLQSGTIERVSFYRSTTRFVEFVKKSGNFSSVAITGHSLGGGLALISGAQTHVQAIGISAPNAMIARERFGITPDELNRYTFNVIPDQDPIAMADDPVNTIQRIQCRADKNRRFDCHTSERSICELMYMCGSGSRPVLCECVSVFGYPEPDPNPNTTRTFKESCLARRRFEEQRNKNNDG